MSLGTIDNIMKRIEIATKKSPIAIFESRGRLNAVFGATIDTQNEVQHSSSFIGMFYGAMDLDEVRSGLMRLMK